jgi:hypothetical protein
MNVLKERRHFRGIYPLLLIANLGKIYSHHMPSCIGIGIFRDFPKWKVLPKNKLYRAITHFLITFYSVTLVIIMP